VANEENAGDRSGHAGRCKKSETGSQIKYSRHV
jgi:hypothetical protein